MGRYLKTVKFLDSKCTTALEHFSLCVEGPLKIEETVCRVALLLVTVCVYRSMKLVLHEAQRKRFFRYLPIVLFDLVYVLDLMFTYNLFSKRNA